MSIFAKVLKIFSPNAKANDKFFGRPFVTETIDLNSLAEHMASHNSPFSAGVIKGLMTDMVNCIKELLLEGKNVKIDNLAIFSVKFVSNGGAETWEEWSVPKNIRRVKLHARATGELSSENLNLDVVVKKLDPATVGGAGSADSPDSSDTTA